MLATAARLDIEDFVGKEVYVEVEKYINSRSFHSLLHMF